MYKYHKQNIWRKRCIFTSNKYTSEVFVLHFNYMFFDKLPNNIFSMEK